MFKRSTEKVNLQQLLEESQAQITAAREGDFNYNISYTTEDEQLHQILCNFKELNILRDQYERRLENQLNAMVHGNRNGILELYLEDI